MAETDYTLSGTKAGEMQAPDLPYQPRDPKNYQPNIGLIACGGITKWHCIAYKKAGYHVVALCDLIEERASSRQAEFFPEAQVTTDYRDVLRRDDIEVVDIATHPPERLPLIEDALRAGKHVLSQKPFVLDLDAGEELADLAEAQGVKLAVNQNGRWAPHFSYIRQAVRAGLLGDVLSIHQGVHWNHTWTKGTPFEEIPDLVFYDFGIHWFDFVSHLLGERKITRIQASKSRSLDQTMKPPMLAQALIEFEGGQASLAFDAHIPHGSYDHTFVGGSAGSILSAGPNLENQTLTITTAAGAASPKLEGCWMPDGFHGSMGELLCAIEENRAPGNSARENLRSLALCFAAIAAANDGQPKIPGEVRRLPNSSLFGVNP